MNARKARPEIIVNLDRPRKLVFDLGAICALEEKLGKSIFKAINWQDLGARDVRLLLWASLLRDEPTITLEQVDDLFSLGAILENQQVLRGLVEEIVSRAIPDDKDLPASGGEKKRSR